VVIFAAFEVKKLENWRAKRAQSAPVGQDISFVFSDF